MTAALSPIIISRLEKAATDNGFDQALAPESDWLVFSSTQCPLRVWLGAFVITMGRTHTHGGKAGAQGSFAALTPTDVLPRR